MARNRKSVPPKFNLSARFQTTYSQLKPKKVDETAKTSPIVQISQKSVYLATHTCSHPFGPKRYSGANTRALFPGGQERFSDP
jgi:hypothetical protein